MRDIIILNDKEWDQLIIGLGGSLFAALPDGSFPYDPAPLSYPCLVKIIKVELQDEHEVYDGYIASFFYVDEARKLLKITKEGLEGFDYAEANT